MALTGDPKRAQHAATIGLLPTPLHPLPRLTELLSGPPIYIKREDLSGLGAGGNKARKLRLLLGEAVQTGATVVLTQGGPQSNHCAQTALAASMLRMDCELFLWGGDPGMQTGNLRIFEVAGARVHFVGDLGPDDLESLIDRRAAQLQEEGAVPYVIGVGGSSLLGISASMTGLEETVGQSEAIELPARLLVAAGSLGTMAGLVLGSWRLKLDWKIDGVTVFMPAPQAVEALESMLRAAHAELCPDAPPMDNYQIVPDQIGAGYGQPTLAAIEAQVLCARSEGILLDTTYTAKAMAGLIAGIRTGRYAKDGSIVFWHTGGLAGFFQ